MGRGFKKIALLFIFLIASSAIFAHAASSLSDINVSNATREAKVSVGFNGVPAYAFFILHSPERVVLDVNQSSIISGLPLNFSGKNLVKSIRTSKPKDAQSVRLVFDLTQAAKAKAFTQKKGDTHTVVFTITALEEVKKNKTPTDTPARAVAIANNSPTAPGSANTLREKTPQLVSKNKAIEHNKLNNQRNSNNVALKREAEKPLTNPEPANRLVAQSTSSGKSPFQDKKEAIYSQAKAPNVSPKRQRTESNNIVVAIDAGHGGQDPGAIGPNGLKEKNVTIAIARRLQTLLQKDPQFKPVLTRSGDYFISVMGRSEVARKQGAHVLVSIHADSAPNSSATGASVWVLNNRRANSEMANWLEQHEKQSELLGGAGDLLANRQADPYLSQAVLDLQFGHSQRVGYDVAVKVLQEMGGIGELHKRRPQPASLGVLRSPDIPSVLVETGFISNAYEERLLGSGAYQNKVAQAIYNGLRHYFLEQPLQADPKGEKHSIDFVKSVKTPSLLGYHSGKTKVHIVQRGETLSGIAKQYGVNMAKLYAVNKLQKNSVWSGQRLQIPISDIIADKVVQNATSTKKVMRHKVVPGDTLSSIAARYGVSISQLKNINRLKSDIAPLNKVLTIPPVSNQ